MYAVPVRTRPYTFRTPLRLCRGQRHRWMSNEGAEVEKLQYGNPNSHQDLPRYKQRRLSRSHWQDQRTVWHGLPNEQLRQSEHRTFRLRKHGNKELPLPPFLDPAIFRIEMKYTQLDQQKWLKNNDVKTGLRKELIANPYAAALRTPVRHCCYTGARLPAHFLQRFRIHRLDSERLLRIRPYNEVSKADHLTSSSTYVSSHPEIITLIGKKDRHGKTIHRNLAAHAAEVYNMSPQSYALHKKIVWDKETMPREIEKQHYQHIREKLRHLLKDYPHLLPEDSIALTKLPRITAFIRLVDGLPSLTTYRGQFCYGLPRAVLSDKEEDGPPIDMPDLVGLYKCNATVPLALALDRAYAYKGLIRPTTEDHKLEFSNQQK